MLKDQTPAGFDRVTWAALAAAGDHFAAMGGGNQYAGYDASHPTLLVGLLLLAIERDPTLPSRVTATGEACLLDAEWLHLAAQSPEVAACIEYLEPANGRRFPAKFLCELMARLQGVVITPTDLLRFRLLAEERLPRPLPSCWLSFTRHVLGS